jgi:hypothetical protein
MYIGAHVKYRSFCQILMKLEFCRRTFERSSDTPVGAELLHAEGRTDGQT